MYKTDADGQEWVLRTKNGTAHVGSHYADFRGEMAKLVGGQPPHKPSSSGFVHVERVDGPVKSVIECYAGVFDMEWMKVIPTHRPGEGLKRSTYGASEREVGRLQGLDEAVEFLRCRPQTPQMIALIESINALKEQAND